jgi:hypothetical protein
MMDLLALTAVLAVRVSIAPIRYFERVSMPPIRYFEPYPRVGCPKGYAVWWPANREFDNDKYAECVKYVAPAKASARKRPHKPAENQRSMMRGVGQVAGSK